MPLTSSIPLTSGFIDEAELLAGRLFRVSGWTLDDPHRLLELQVDGRAIGPSACFRTYRPDVSAATGNPNRFLGFAQEYILAAASNASIDLSYNGHSILSMKATITVLPDYPDLLGSDRVLARDLIYSEGPPATIVTPEILALALQLPDPILDFGCGGCGPLRALLDAGRNVSGIEISGSLAASAIPEDLRSLVTIYDGSFPMPFPDASFNSVLATEVIEHVPNYRAAIADIARVASRAALFTVPDNSVIPICAGKGLIPWHYLTGDHLHFFTQQSLTAAIKPHFEDVQVYRAPQLRIDGLLTYSNILAMCFKG